MYANVDVLLLVDLFENFRNFIFENLFGKVIYQWKMTLLSNKKKSKKCGKQAVMFFYVSSCNIKVDHFCIFYYILIFNFFICLYYVFACSICICLYVIDELYSFIINSIQCNFINFISEYITFLTSKSLLQFNIDLLFLWNHYFL